MKRVILAVLASALLAAGCTTTSALDMGDGRVVLTTRGNAYTTPEKVERDLLLEASRRTVAAGYDWFLMVDGQDVTTSGTAYIPATGQASAYCGAYSCSGQSTYRGGQTINYTLPGQRVTVQFGRGTKPQGAVDARAFIAANGGK